MSKAQEENKDDSLSLLSSVLQHLPDVLNNSKVASSAFSALRSASQNHKSLPFISPALPPITSAVLSAPVEAIREDAAVTCVALVQALVGRRLTDLASAYVADLGAAARRIIEHDSSTPLTALLPDFVNYARRASTDEEEISSLNALKTPPVPVSPTSLERLLLLIAALIPSNTQHPLSAGSASSNQEQWDTFASDSHAAVSTASVRLWVCLKSSARDAVLSLAANYHILSGRCGIGVALAAVKILDRALDAASGCVVPVDICDRLCAVVEAALFDIRNATISPDDKRKIQSALYKLSVAASRTNRLPASLWTACGLHDAVVDDGGVGNLLRSFSKCSLASYENPEVTGNYAAEQLSLSPSPTQPARKKRRVSQSSLDRQGDELTGSQRSCPTQEVIVSRQEAMGSPVSALKWELQSLGSVPSILEDEKSICVLGRVAALTADAISNLLEDPDVSPDAARQWFAFSSSFALIVQDVFADVVEDMSTQTWEALLTAAAENLRLALSLLGVKTTPHPNAEIDAAIASASLSEDSYTLMQSTMYALELASSTVGSKSSVALVQALATLMQGAEEQLKVSKVPPSNRDKLIEVLFRMVKYVLKNHEEFGDVSVTGVLLRSTTRLLAVLRPRGIHLQIQEAIEQASQVFVEKKAIHTAIAAHALYALGDLLCLSVCCSLDHTAQKQGIEEETRHPGCLDESIWVYTSQPVFAVLRGTGADELLAAASYCCGVLVIHAPETKAGEAASLLVRTVWHPTSTAAQQTAISFLSTLFFLHTSRMRDEGEENASITSSFPDCGSEDSWDQLDASLTPKGDVNDTVRLLAVELKQRVQPLENNLQEDMSLRALKGLDVHPLANILNISSVHPLCAKVAGFASAALMGCSIVELQTWRSGVAEMIFDGNDDQGVDGSGAKLHLKAWGCLLGHVTNATTSSKPHDLILPQMEKGVDNMLRNIMARDVVKGVEPLGSTVAIYFSSRMKEWLPFSFRKMIRHELYATQLADLLLLSSLDALWKKVSRQAVGILLRSGDSVGLDSLSSRTGETTKNLVDRRCADALARTVLIQGTGIDLAPDGSNSLIVQSLQQPLKDLVSARAGKIVQRVVMELGGPKDRRARRALLSIGEIMGVHQRSQRSSGAGFLIATHFMLVMDAVNRGLFHSKATEKERVRYLRMLGSVLSLTSDYLHLYVPKILATLKMALELNLGTNFQAQTLRVWCCFLSGLGGKHLLPHLCSVLSILVPFVEKHNAIVCPTLTKLLEEANTHSFNDWNEVTLLLRIAKDPELSKTANALDGQSRKGSGGSRDEWVSSSGSSGNQSFPISTTRLVASCETVCKVLQRQESSDVKGMAVGYLLMLLKVNRKLIDRALLETRYMHEDNHPRIVQAISKLLSVLISSFNMSEDIVLKVKIMECVGEVGAIDPGIVLRYGRAPTDGTVRSTRMRRRQPAFIQELAAVLLNSFLAPALTRKKERGASSSHDNRAGLVIQELLRVCGCKRDTASRASRATRSDKAIAVNWKEVLTEETVEENAIPFWEHLEPSTKTAAEPYLAEPFDIQQYKEVFGGTAAGDVRAACEPVWGKIKAATPSGCTPTAQEWRRQIAVQLVDFIGRHGKYGATLRALRPVLRYNDDVTAYIFPLVVTCALDFQRGKAGTEVQEFLAKEIAAVLGEGVSPQPVFELFDTLRLWREDRCSSRGKLISAKSQGYASGQGRGYSKGRIPVLANIERERISDPLSPLIDLNGHESPALSLLLQAKSASRARSFSRSVMFAEYFLRNVRAKRGFTHWPSCIEDLHANDGTHGRLDAAEKEALEVLRRCYAELEDSASLTGISVLQESSSLADYVIDSEVAGRYDEALITYERALAEHPRDLALHSGFFRCLMTLGHWETMLSHAEGLVSSAKMNELNLRRSAQAHGINAAWRLGRWDKVQDFKALSVDAYNQSTDRTATSWELDFNMSFGNMLLSLRENDKEALTRFATESRKFLIEPLTQLSREGYGRAYQVVTLLHCVSEVEDCVDSVCQSSTQRSSGQRGTLSAREPKPLLACNGRMQAATPSLRIHEPLLSARRACLEVLNKSSEAAKVGLRLSELAHQSENLRAAAACAYAASRIETSQDSIKNAVAIQMATVRHAQGDAPGALLMIKREIERLGGGRNGSKASLQNVPDEALSRLCTAYVLAGRWTEELRSESSEVVQNYYEQAAIFGPYREEPFYALGRHYDTLFQAAAGESRNQQDDGNGARSSRRSGAGASASGNLLQVSHFVPLIIRSFSKVLCNGHSRVYEVLPRMLTVWFDYHSAANCADPHLLTGPVEGEVKREMKKAFTSIPIYMWMTAIPQLMSRLLHPRKVVRDELVSLLARIVCKYPDQSAWLITPSNQLKSTERKQITNTILSTATVNAKKARAAENEGDRQSLPQKLKTRIQRSICVIRELVQICLASVPREKRACEANFSQEFRRLKETLRASTTTPINPMMPTLQSLTVRMPVGSEEGHRPFDEEPVCITDIHDYAYVMASLMRPRRIILLGSDGRHYKYLAKKETSGDMRKDSRLMEFMTVVNRLLSKHPISQNREITLKTYAVLPLTEESGMIEWVDHLEPLRKAVREQHSRIADLPDMAAIQNKHQKTKDKVKFHEWAMRMFPPVLDKHFLEAYGAWGDPQSWLNARNMWTQSVAVWSMAGYVVGLGDRHGENILIEGGTGRCVHVDFAMLFDKGANLKVPEIVPFRLTPNMVTAMGVAGYEGLYRFVAETMMGILRQNADALLGVLETFLYDPLVDWGKSETRVTNGNIQVVTSREAWESRAMVKAKLKGMMDESGLALSISGQVQRLISEATTSENLSRMYIWWSGWI